MNLRHTHTDARFRRLLAKTMIAAGIVGLVVLSPLALTAVTGAQDQPADGSASNADWDEVRDAAQSQAGDQTVSEYVSAASFRWSMFVSMLAEWVLYALPITSLLMIFAGWGVLNDATMHEQKTERVRTDG